MNTPSKLSTPPNLTIFWDRNSTQYRKVINQWPFQVEGALATNREEAVSSAMIRSIRGAAHELLEFIGYDEEMSVILRHIKE